MPLHDPMLRQLRSLLLSSGLLLGVLLTSGQAQVTTTITPDGTLGTTVTQSGTVHDITGGTRPGNGPNLFHSFDRFSVGTNDTARFSGPTGIVNILNRVTGGSSRSSMGGCSRPSPGRICICSTQVGCCLAQMPAWTSAGVSRQHGRRAALCGRGHLFGAHRREEHLDDGATGGLWVFGTYSGCHNRPGQRSRGV